MAPLSNLITGTKTPPEKRNVASKHQAPSSGSSVTSSVSGRSSNVDQSPSPRIPTFKIDDFELKHNIPRERHSAGSPNRISGLAAFGLKKSPRASEYTRDCVLYAVVIKASDGIYIIYRIEGLNSKVSNMGEKYLADEVCGNMKNKYEQSTWAEGMGFDPKHEKWFHHDVAMVNFKNYNKKLFIIHSDNEDLPSDEQVMGIGECICKHINAIEGNNVQTRPAPPNSFYWIPPGECVWYDILGWSGACARLMRTTGHSDTGRPSEGFWKDNITLIRSYFRKGELPRGLVEYLHAPNDEINIDERDVPRSINANNDDNDDNGGDNDNDEEDEDAKQESQDSVMAQE